MRQERQRHVDAIDAIKKRHEAEVPILAARAHAARHRLERARDAAKTAEREYAECFTLLCGSGMAAEAAA